MKRLSIKEEQQEEENQVQEGSQAKRPHHYHQPICIGMINTDIVVEKPPLMLIRDEQYEIVTLESEGKLNTENYCKKISLFFYCEPHSDILFSL